MQFSKELMDKIQDLLYSDSPTAKDLLYFISFEEFMEAPCYGYQEISHNGDTIYRIKRNTHRETYAVDFLPMNDSFQIADLTQVLELIQK